MMLIRNHIKFTISARKYCLTLNMKGFIFITFNTRAFGSVRRIWVSMEVDMSSYETPGSDFCPAVPPVRYRLCLKQCAVSDSTAKCLWQLSLYTETERVAFSLLAYCLPQINHPSLPNSPQLKL